MAAMKSGWAIRTAACQRVSSGRSRLPMSWLTAAVLLCLSCATTGPGGKKSVILIPTRQEAAIGASMARQIARTERVLADTVWQNYLAGVGRDIVTVCDRRDIEYHFTVIESEQVNAFAIPGGYVFFYTGLLRQLESEAELAAVLAHEISHVVARHGVKRLQAAMGVSLAWELVFGDDISQAVEAAAQLGLLLVFSGYSRAHEREADRFAVHYMIKAGYDPYGAVSMLEKLAALGDAGYPNVFDKLAASHPETKERIANVRAQIAEMGPLPAGLVDGTDRYRQMRRRLPAPAASSSK